MKRYIRSSQSDNYLTLAKGIMVDTPAWKKKYMSAQDIQSAVNMLIIELPATIKVDFVEDSYRFMIYSTAKYDVETDRLVGRILNYTELMDCIPTDLFNPSKAVPFSVELTPSEDATELVVGGDVNSNVRKFLKDKFNVSR